MSSEGAPCMEPALQVEEGCRSAQALQSASMQRLHECAKAGGALSTWAGLGLRGPPGTSLFHASALTDARGKFSQHVPARAAGMLYGAGAAAARGHRRAHSCPRGAADVVVSAASGEGQALCALHAQNAQQLHVCAASAAQAAPPRGTSASLRKRTGTSSVTVAPLQRPRAQEQVCAAAAPKRSRRLRGLAEQSQAHGGQSCARLRKAFRNTVGAAAWCVQLVSTMDACRASGAAVPVAA